MADEPITPAGGEGASSDQPDLGLSRDEGGILHVDFGSAIDEGAAKIGVIKEGGEAAAGASGPSEDKGGEGAGATGPTKAKEDEGTGASGATGGTETPVASAAKPAPTRDDDIAQLRAKLDPHTSPKTREHFDAQAKLLVEARDRAEAREKEAAALKTELEERKKLPLPKEAQKRIDQLTEQIRELDVTRDPAIVEKYDKKITQNEDVIIKGLVENGLDEKVAKQMRKVGFSLNSLKPLIDLIETGDDGQGNKANGGVPYDPNPELAEQIRDALRENNNLSKQRETEITASKATYDTRRTQSAAEEETRLTEANSRMNKEFKSHLDKYDFLSEPPKPLETDTPEVRKQKEKAIADFNETVIKFSDTIKKETADPVSAQISARIGILYRDHVVPNLQKKIARLEADLTEREGRLKALRKAGGVTPSLRSTDTAPKREDPSETEGFGDAVDKMAAAAGIKVK